VSYTQQLHQLQQIDNQIQAVEARLAEIAAHLVESEALKSAKIAFDQADVAYRQARTTTTNLELEVKGLQERIAQNEKHLYSGTMKNPKEAAALQEEIASSKRWLGQREEDLLEAMIESEEAEITRQAQKELLGRIQQEWKTEQINLIQEQEGCQNELETLIKSRAAVAQFIDQGDLASYERLRRKFSGIGLAVVKNGICLSCGVMLSSRFIQQALSDNQLHYCDSCHRIVHIL